MKESLYSEDIEQYFQREVEPHLPHSWIDFDKSKEGYEINFTKYFYQVQTTSFFRGYYS